MRQRTPCALGLTQASTVMRFVRSSEAASATVTQSLTPSNASAAPVLPVPHVAPEIVPIRLLPESSATVVPLPASNEYAATSPGATALVEFRAGARGADEGDQRGQRHGGEMYGLDGTGSLTMHAASPPSAGNGGVAHQEASTTISES